MKLNKSYTAESIEVLSGLEPVRRRPGMYTDTTNPNHLAHEAIDNSVDEAMEGYATLIQVTLYKDGSLMSQMMAVVCRLIFILKKTSLASNLFSLTTCGCKILPQTISLFRRFAWCGDFSR